VMKAVVIRVAVKDVKLLFNEPVSARKVVN
jgi:hypothetical protein